MATTTAPRESETIANDLTVRDILARDLSRRIEPVVKVYDRSNLAEDLRQFVITDSLARELRKFLDAFTENLRSRIRRGRGGDGMAVWLWGFFGSGKSHVAKVLGHILENDVVEPEGNRRAIDPFNVHLDDPNTRQPKPLRDWTILDPCGGSGHFLVVAFGLLVQLYAEERRLAEAGRVPPEWVVPEEDVARTILERNLYGIDIDPRAVQIAALALYLKAKGHGFAVSDGPPRLNLVAPDAVLARGSAYEALLAPYQHDVAVHEAIEAIWHALEHVQDLGSLVRVDEDVDAAVRKAKREEDRHSPLLSSAKDWDAYKRTLLGRLRAAFEAESHSEDIAARIFGAEGAKGVGLLELLSRRYDVVCTNPPYMGSKNMGLVLKNFITKHYAPGKRDLYAAFILRCRELAEEDGHVAMVTQQSWMFLRSFADLRAVHEDNPNTEVVSEPKTRPRGAVARKAKLGQFRGILRQTSIETLAHLGPGAFAEISGEVVNIALFTLRNALPTPEYRMTAFRLIGLKSPEWKAEVLRRALIDQEPEVRSSLRQWDLMPIPEAPLVYWLRPRFFELLQSPYRLRDIAEIRQGLATTDNDRFVRCFWEVSDFGVVRDCKPVSGRWFWYAKGGRYQKWAGLEWLVVDWERNGEAIKKFVVTLPGTTHWSRRVASESYYFNAGLTYTPIARGSFGVRTLINAIFGHKANLIIATKAIDTAVATQLNSRLISFLIRSVSQSRGFEVSHVSAIPLVRNFSEDGFIVGKICIDLKCWLVMEDALENTFIRLGLERASGFSLTICSRLDEHETHAVQATLHTVEGLNERLIFDVYELAQSDVLTIFDETGTPTGWHPLIIGYDALPALPPGLPPIPPELTEHLAAHERISASPEELPRIKNRLRALYIAGPGAKLHDAEEEAAGGDGAAEDDEEEEAIAVGACIPIPAETFLEELSQNMEIHPISVYWLLEEMRREEGLVCPPELKRHTEDYFSVKLLRMLGHRWPTQDQYEREAGKPFLDPKWVDADGMIPLTPGTGEETLIERFRRFLDEEFGPERGPSVETEAGQILGWRPGDAWGQQRPTTLARWFERDFFRRHISQFKRRPIAWHLTSPKGTFQAIVYYHRFDKNRLTLLRAPLRARGAGVTAQTAWEGTNRRHRPAGAGESRRPRSQDCRRAGLR